MSHKLDDEQYVYKPAEMHVFCAKCKRPLQRVGCLDEDGFVGCKLEDCPKCDKEKADES